MGTADFLDCAAEVTLPSDECIEDGVAGEASDLLDKPPRGVVEELESRQVRHQRCHGTQMFEAGGVHLVSSRNGYLGEEAATRRCFILSAWNGTRTAGRLGQALANGIVRAFQSPQVLASCSTSGSSSNVSVE